MGLLQRAAERLRGSPLWFLALSLRLPAPPLALDQLLALLLVLRRRLLTPPASPLLAQRRRWAFQRRLRLRLRGLTAKSFQKTARSSPVTMLRMRILSFDLTDRRWSTAARMRRHRHSSGGG